MKQIVQIFSLCGLVLSLQVAAQEQPLPPPSAPMNPAIDQSMPPPPGTKPLPASDAPQTATRPGDPASSAPEGSVEETTAEAQPAENLEEPRDFVSNYNFNIEYNTSEFFRAELSINGQSLQEFEAQNSDGLEKLILENIKSESNTAEICFSHVQTESETEPSIRDRSLFKLSARSKDLAGKRPIILGLFSQQAKAFSGERRHQMGYRECQQISFWGGSVDQPEPKPFPKERVVRTFKDSDQPTMQAGQTPPAVEPDAAAPPTPTAAPNSPQERTAASISQQKFCLKPLSPPGEEICEWVGTESCQQFKNAAPTGAYSSCYPKAL